MMVFNKVGCFGCFDDNMGGILHLFSIKVKKCSTAELHQFLHKLSLLQSTLFTIILCTGPSEGSKEVDGV